MTAQKLLFVANSSWNLTNMRGGLIRALTADGHEIHAAVPLGDAEVPLAAATHRFPLRADSLSPVAELRTILGLIRLTRSVRPAAILSFTPKGNIYAGLAAKATGTPLLPNISGLGTAFIRGGYLERLQTQLYRVALSAAPSVFFQNEEDRSLFLRRGLASVGQARLIPGSGIDLTFYAPQPLFSHEVGTARVLFIGRMLGDKGLRELTAAIRILKPRYPGLDATLLGALGAANRTAIDAEELRSWEREGLVSHVAHQEDVRPYIAASDAVILPSYREGMPRALLEGAAMGRPLLASNVPGCRQIVRHGETGLLFVPRSAGSTAASLAQFLELGRAERERMGMRARHMVEQEYDEQLVFAAYREALVDLGHRKA